MLNKVITILVVLAAILFITNGLRWLIDPAGIVDMFGLELASGAGLSTQVGDLASFFLTLGLCMMMGVVLSKAHWFYPAIALLGFAALGRIVAWLIHDAALSMDMIAVEILISVLLWVAAKRLASN